MRLFRNLAIRVLLAGCLAFTGFAASAQLLFEPYQNVPLYRNGQRLKLAWAGGLQAPQFNRMDLNFDGLGDIVLFDRADEQILTFVNTGTGTDTSYRYAPEYEVAFPKTLHNWVILADYNCDNLPDIFTGNGNASGVAVYTNTNSGSGHSFALANPALATAFGPLEVPTTDLPSVTDVDGDGDLDVLAFGFSGDRIIWYQNERVEQNLPCNSLQFSIGSACWGELMENALNSGITLGLSCRLAGPGWNTDSTEQSLHAGSSLLVFDADGDGDKDALIGDISSQTMVFTQSNGSVMVSQTTAYPPAQPINLFLFPSAFLHDVNTDGEPDLIVTTSDGEPAGGRNFEQVHLYLNQGTAQQPVFTFTRNDFLSGEMLELGSGAAPAFLDEDGDGDLDLLVGNYSYREDATQTYSRLALFRNTGSNAATSYELTNPDYLGLTSSTRFGLSPATGDVDNDGDQDLLIGDDSGKLLYLQNTAPVGQAPVFAAPTGNFNGIDVGSFSTPHLVDLDRDGDQDLLIGELRGNINYYSNSGNGTFTLVTDSLGKILVRESANLPGYSAPYVTDLNGNGNYDLLVGDFEGRVRIYPDFEANLVIGLFTETDSTLLLGSQVQSRLQHGRQVKPAAADISGDGKPDLLTGQYRGGILLYRNISSATGLAEDLTRKELKVWPVPASEILHYQSATTNPVTITIINTLGQMVYQASGQPVSGSLSIGYLPAGIYLFQVQDTSGRTGIRRFVRH